MIFRNIYDFLASARLAIASLIVILVCCLLGVTVWRGADAGRVIFGTLWFNGLLVLLVINVSCCFFPRALKRRLTLISLGMILFHLSFVVMLGGIIYNSLFNFRGVVRLTEGETVPNDELQSYDFAEAGRFFNLSRLKGDTTLIAMHKGYKVDGEEKVVAYEISVGDGASKKTGVVYATHSVGHRGFSYFRDREGHSILVVLYDKQGRELYGAHVALQSQKQKDGSMLYTSGTRHGPGSFPFPQSPADPLFNLQVALRPDPQRERAGEVFFQLWPLENSEGRSAEVPLSQGKAQVGGRFDAGGYLLEVREVRYWVGMTVRYEPGQPIVLASLWVGLAGMVITFIGRLRRGKRQDNRGQITEDR